MILNFSDYVIDNQTVSKVTDIRYPSFQGYYEEIAAPLNYEIFNQVGDICPFCKVETLPGYFDYHGNELAYQIMAVECPNCGWWQVTHDIHNIELDNTEDHHITRSIVYNSILKAFKEDDLNLPMNVLIEEYQKRPEILYEIHSTKMELLTKDILKDFFDSEVHHVGKTADGGIDLLLLDKENPILIQVKRRTKKESVESISTVRDLLGAMFIKNSQKGMIVSTANHFSKTALKTGKELVDNGKLISFDMINFKEFCSMLNLVRGKKKAAWHDLAQKRFR